MMYKWVRLLLSVLSGTAVFFFCYLCFGHVIDEELNGLLVLGSLICATVVALGVNETIIQSEEEDKDL